MTVVLRKGTSDIVHNQNFLLCILKEFGLIFFFFKINILPQHAVGILYLDWTHRQSGFIAPPQNTFPELNKGEKKRFLSLLYACALHAC